jgi:hypothetical protein
MRSSALPRHPHTTLHPTASRIRADEGCSKEGMGWFPSHPVAFPFVSPRPLVQELLASSQQMVPRPQVRDLVGHAEDDEVAKVPLKELTRRHHHTPVLPLGQHDALLPRLGFGRQGVLRGSRRRRLQRRHSSTGESPAAAQRRGLAVAAAAYLVSCGHDAVQGWRK